MLCQWVITAGKLCDCGPDLARLCTARSLALVTCREPLRGSLSAQLRSLLAPSLERDTLDNAVGVLTADNLELGCSVIEKTTADKAIREIDERLAPAYQVADFRVRVYGSGIRVRIVSTSPCCRRAREGPLKLLCMIVPSFCALPQLCLSRKDVSVHVACPTTTPTQQLGAVECMAYPTVTLSTQRTSLSLVSE